MLIMKKPSNPVAARVLPMAGRQLPQDWHRATAEHGGQFDRRNPDEMFANPQWTKLSSSENLTQAARLTAWKDILGEK